MTAAVGIAVGVGPLWLPAVGVVLALIMVSLLRQAERRIGRKRPSRDRRRNGARRT